MKEKFTTIDVGELLRPYESPLEKLKRQNAEPERREQDDRAVPERERLKAMPPKYVITLVHGTQLFRWIFEPIISLSKGRAPKGFVNGPAWIQRDSLMANHLRQALGGRAWIEPFRWKGNNTIRARAVAAGQLRTHLATMAEQYEGAQQVVIGHSHGGNVIFSALNDPVTAAGILGVATLATPFLNARTRPVEGLLDGSAAIVAALMSGFATLAAGLALGHGWSWWPWGLVTSAAVVAIFLGGIWTGGAMNKLATNIEKAIGETKLTREQVTIVRTRGDEAVAVIAGARVAGAFVDLAWRRVSEPMLKKLSKLLEWIDYFGMRSIMEKLDRDFPRNFDSNGSPRPFALPQTEQPTVFENIKKTLIPLIGPVSVSLLQDKTIPAGRWVVLIIAVAYGFPAFVGLLFTLIGVIPAIVFSLGLLPCGWSVPLAGPFLDMTAEPAPPGTWLVTQFEPDGRTSLAHSKSYNDRRVHEHLATWINDLAIAKEKKAAEAMAGGTGTGQ